MKLLLIHGPNLNMLGRREPEIYGHTTLAQIDDAARARASSAGAALLAFQSNHEGALIDKIGTQRMAIIDWPIGIVYGFVCLGFALMTWRAVDVAIANWKRGASVLEQPELADAAP